MQVFSSSGLWLAATLLAILVAGSLAGCTQTVVIERECARFAQQTVVQGDATRTETVCIQWREWNRSARWK